jgi:hypothetical protein
MTRVVTFMALAFFVAGCGDFAIGPAVADFSAKLCGDYYVHRAAAHQIQISPMRWRGDTPIIPEKVVELGHDQRFVVAEQNHLKRRSPDNLQDTYMEPDPGVFSYWILDVSVPKAYGSLTEDEFWKKRKELGVSDELTMKDVYSYRK